MVIQVHGVTLLLLRQSGVDARPWRTGASGEWIFEDEFWKLLTKQTSSFVVSFLVSDPPGQELSCFPSEANRGWRFFAESSVFAQRRFRCATHSLFTGDADMGRISIFVWQSCFESTNIVRLFVCFSSTKTDVMMWWTKQRLSCMRVEFFLVRYFCSPKNYTYQDWSSSRDRCQLYASRENCIIGWLWMTFLYIDFFCVEYLIVFRWHAHWTESFLTKNILVNSCETFCNFE